MYLSLYLSLSLALSLSTDAHVHGLGKPVMMHIPHSHIHKYIHLSLSLFLFLSLSLSLSLARALSLSLSLQTLMFMQTHDDAHLSWRFHMFYFYCSFLSSVLYSLSHPWWCADPVRFLYLIFYILHIFVFLFLVYPWWCACPVRCTWGKRTANATGRHSCVSILTFSFIFLKF